MANYCDYESPINIMYDNINAQINDQIVNAVLKMNIDINKQELLKALAYDRDQYYKGFKDGINTIANNIIEKINEAYASFEHNGDVRYGFDICKNIIYDLIEDRSPNK